VTEFLRVAKEDVPEYVWIVVEEAEVCPTCRQEDFDMMVLSIIRARVSGLYWERASGDVRLRLMYGDYTEVEMDYGRTYSSEAQANEAKHKMGKEREENV